MYITRKQCFLKDYIYKESYIVLDEQSNRDHTYLLAIIKIAVIYCGIGKSVQGGNKDFCHEASLL